MVRASRQIIDGVSFTYGELRALYYLTRAGEASLKDIAAYCGVKKPQTHSYLSALKQKKLVSMDAKVSSVPSDCRCTDLERAEVILAKVQPGIIDQSVKIEPREVVVIKVFNGYKVRVDGVWFKLSALRIFKCLIEASLPMKASEIVKKAGTSTTSGYDELARLTAVGRLTKVGDRYRCSDPKAIKAILDKVESKIPRES